LDERLPQYLHRPVQILWFASDEFVLVLVAVFVAAVVGGLVGWMLIGALLLFIPWQRTKPRGFLPHLAWRWGLLSLRGYPGPTQTRFFE
jgi:type IV conjugative transfer system protein TraL